MPSITPRKDKHGNIISYTIRVYRGYDSSGNRLKPYTMTWKPDARLTAKQTEKELARQAAQFEEQCKNGCAANPTMKLQDFCAEYLDIMKPSLSPATFAFYQSEIQRHIIPALGHLKLREITAAHVQKYIQQLAAMPKTERDGTSSGTGETVSPSTVRRYLTVLQSIFKQAVKLGIIPETPAKSERLTLPKAIQPKIEIFNMAEAAEMLACLEQEDIQFQTLIQLAIFTGARRGELVALKFSDVDYEQAKITIERAAVKLKDQKTIIKPPKDYEVRTVTVNQSCLELIRMLQLEKMREAQRLGTQWQGADTTSAQLPQKGGTDAAQQRATGGNWLFTTWNGEIMNPQTPTKQFSKFLKKNGLQHRKFHSLRHTSATLLLYGGINVKQVQSRLGHGDIETTNKYLHVLEEADIEAANVLGAMLVPTARKTGRQIS